MPARLDQKCWGEKKLRALGRCAVRVCCSLSIVLAVSLVSACGNGNEPSESGGGRAPYPEVPQNGSVNGERNFATLLRRFSQGKVNQMPWAGYWWPYSRNGIAHAARLYEQGFGRSGAVAWETENHGAGLPALEDWWGHCNGWAAAAVLSREPRSAQSQGGVSFGVAEQKALLSEVAMEVGADFFGRRNDSSSDTSSSVYEDVYPNQFFLVLTNFVGKGFPLVVDRYTGNQVWNHPLAGYQIAPVKPEDYLGQSSNAANLYRIVVSTKLWWVRDDVEGGHLTEAFAFQDGPSYASRVLRFELWLDGPVEFDGSGNVSRSGNIVLARQGDAVLGGDWRNPNLSPSNSHPDYIWIPRRILPSSGYTNPRIDAQEVVNAFGG